MTNNKTLESMLNRFLPFAQKTMGFKAVPEIRFESDETNAQDPLGKTAYYEPNNSRITVYTVGRHPKDIMRSISHELVHHTQNGKGAFANSMTVGEQGYAQNDEHLREMEREAYEQGNLCFRDWEDSIKTQHNEVLDMWQKRNKKLNESVMKKFGYVNEVSMPPVPREVALALRGGDVDRVADELERTDPRFLQSLLGIYHECDIDDPRSIDCLASNLMIDAGGGDASRGEPHSYEPEDMGYNAGTPLVTKENLEGEYDAGYRDRLDQAQAANPERTMPEIEDMLATGGEGSSPSPVEEPIPNSGGERYEVGDSIRDEDNRTGQILELTAYGAIAQFEGEAGPEKIRFKHMTKSAGDKALAQPELGDEAGFSPDTMGLSEDEELAGLQEEFPEAFQVVVGEDGAGCAEPEIQLVVGGEEDVTVMTQEADEGDNYWEDKEDDDLYELRNNRLHEKLTKYFTK